MLRDARQTMDEHAGPIPVAELDRVSTGKESQKTSLKYQSEIIQAFCEIRNFTIIMHFSTVRSGKFLNKRDDIPRMLNALKKEVIKGIVMKEISRSSRDIVDSLLLKRKIELAGGFLVAIKENYDSRTDSDEFLFTLQAGLAQRERKTTEGRVKLTQIAKAKKGLPNTATPAFGYKRDHDTQKYIKHPEHYKTFRFIVEKYTIDRWGIARIRKDLNSREVKTQRGKEWHYNAIKTILTNPVYLGYIIYNATTTIRDENGNPKLVVRPPEDWITVENAHDPLMTVDEFELIQKIMQERKEKYGHEGNSAKKYLLSGILYCDTCGDKIYGVRMPLNKRKTKYVRYYRCQGMNGKCGKVVCYDMDRVDKLVLDMLRDIFSNKEKLLSAMTAQLKDAEPEEQTQINELQKRQSQIEQIIKNYFNTFETPDEKTGEMPVMPDEVRDRINAFSKQKKEIQAQLDRYKSAAVREQTIERATEFLNRIEEKLDNLYDMPFQEKAEYLEAMFEKLFINAEYQITNVVFNQF
jgi:DNA invertase Pin-like site-specific DNA recombinase